jgi:AcrR family transcriptional regulator
MERLAEEAGVGKGTLFRRFGDRAGLFHALLDDSERELQEGFLFGPPPLGPGAPPRDRLLAFGRALLELTVRHGELLVAATPATPEAQFQHPVYAAHRAHLRTLLDELRVQASGYVADVLLAALAPPLVLAQMGTGSRPADIETAWCQMAEAIARAE